MLLLLLAAIPDKLGLAVKDVISSPVCKIHNILLLPLWSCPGALFISCTSVAWLKERRFGF